MGGGVNLLRLLVRFQELEGVPTPRCGMSAGEPGGGGRGGDGAVVHAKLYCCSPHPMTFGMLSGAGGSFHSQVRHTTVAEIRGVCVRPSACAYSTVAVPVIWLGSGGRAHLAGIQQGS